MYCMVPFCYICDCDNNKWSWAEMNVQQITLVMVLFCTISVTIVIDSGTIIIGATMGLPKDNNWGDVLYHLIHHPKMISKVPLELNSRITQCLTLYSCSSTAKSVVLPQKRGPDQWRSSNTEKVLICQQDHRDWPRCHRNGYDHTCTCRRWTIPINY